MYVLGYRSLGEAEALDFGKRWHLGMDTWWNNLPLEEVLAAATQEPCDPFMAAKLRVLLEGYDARWGAEFSSTPVMGVEQEFRTPIVNPETGASSRTFELGGKIDVLLERAFMEHKTTSEEIGFGSVYWRTLMIDSQVSTYYAGAKALGQDVERCVYDVVKKPELRPKQVPCIDDHGQKIVFDEEGKRVKTKDGKKWRETADAALGYRLWTRPETVEEFEARLTDDVASNPDKYYQRGEVVRLEAEERDYLLDTWQLTQVMREDERLGRHPRNADACKRFGRMCEFFDVCTGVAQLDDASRFQRVQNVHQELTGA